MLPSRCPGLRAVRLDGDWKQEWDRVVALVNELDSADDAVRSGAFSLLWRGDELMKDADGALWLPCMAPRS